MTDDTGERLGAVENELTSLGTEVTNLGTKVTTLGTEVTQLRVLEEENARKIGLIAEGHGAKLDSLGARLDSQSRKLDSHGRKLNLLGSRLNDVIKALAPLEQIKDFIERVAGEHERRITALEKHTNLLE